MYTRISVPKDSHMTATLKRHILQVINENKPEWFGVFLKVNRMTLKIEKTEVENVFNVTQIQDLPDWVGRSVRTYHYVVTCK